MVPPTNVSTAEAQTLELTLSGDGAGSKAVVAPCYHCGTPGPAALFAHEGHPFCCAGCRTVYQILHENGLEQFYRLEQTPGARVGQAPAADRFASLDHPDVRTRLADFADGRTTRITFHVPAIHCAACVWLLENLYRLQPGIGRSTVNFPRREVAISFADEHIKPSQVAGLLASLGYEPVLRLNDLDKPARDPALRRAHLQIGVAGFAFGNIMMLSFPSYLGLNPVTEAALQRMFGWLSLAIAAPVLIYSAADYWKAAWRSIRQKIITIEFPIAIGLAALFGQSLFDILTHRGEGYLDSFAGLVFLLLCGKLFQRKTFNAMAFDRDYRSYFPLSVTKLGTTGEEVLPATALQVGDAMIVRNQELIPADCVLESGSAMIDYSFVTGEAEPVPRARGEQLYAGGRQVGSPITLRVTKPVSQSYLTSLWNNEAFRKPGEDDLDSLTNRAGRWFVVGVVILAAAVALFWSWRDPSMVLRTFTAILLVACPCALALSAPFALGTAMRVLGRRGFYLKNTAAVERLARITTTVFDKTGTLTLARARCAGYDGAPLGAAEQSAVAALAAHSTHPHSRCVAETLGPSGSPLSEYREVPGQGIEARADGRLIRLGHAGWTGAQSVADDGVARVFVAVDGQPRGCFRIAHEYRPSFRSVVTAVAGHGAVAMLSGDRPRDAATLRAAFGERADLRFEQQPADKLEYVRALQARGQRVMMLGDGLNDAGALRQSDVGVAVTEDITSFSPACDAILDARAFDDLPRIRRFAGTAMNVLRLTFAVSLAYNAAGLAFAASGRLSPMVSAILMPLSSFSVMAVAMGATRLAAWRAGLGARS
jgi:Cu+-exporting ATPase